MWIVQLQQAGRLGSKLHHLWLSGLRQRRRQRQTERDRGREGDRERERYTETDAETETQRQRDIETETSRDREIQREGWRHRDTERCSVETRSHRHRCRVRVRGGETSRDTAGTGARCPAAPARLAETRIPSWGFHWKPNSPTGALSHVELQLKTS